MKSRLETSKPPPISGVACVAMRNPLENILLLRIPARLCPHLLIIQLNVSLLKQFVWKCSLAFTAAREGHGGVSHSCTNLKVKNLQKESQRCA